MYLRIVIEKRKSVTRKKYLSWEVKSVTGEVATQGSIGSVSIKRKLEIPKKAWCFSFFSTPFNKIFSFIRLVLRIRTSIERPVDILSFARRFCSNFIHRFHSTHHFSKNGIILIQMRRSAEAFYILPADIPGIFLFKSSYFYRIQSGISKFFSLYNIKLAGAAHFLRIDVIAFPGCRQYTSFMKKSYPEFRGIV